MFLDELKSPSVFTDAEQQLLAAFLEQVDLAKYARWDQVARDSLIDAADRVIRRRPVENPQKELPAS